MPSIERLLTMGLAHGANPARVLLGAAGVSTRATDQVEWTDVLQGVVRLPRMQRAALYLRVVPQLVEANELAELTAWLWGTLIAFDAEHATYTAKEREQGVESARQAMIVRAALREYADPRTCRICLGGGSVLDYIEGRGMVKGTCGKCEGKGWRAWSERARAHAAGIPPRTWLRRHTEGYAATLSECYRTYSAGSKGLRHALFGHPDDASTVGAIESRLQAGV
jgi:hypothetical protein